MTILLLISLAALSINKVISSKDLTSLLVNAVGYGKYAPNNQNRICYYLLAAVCLKPIQWLCLCHIL
ncbi:MAG: hypothetical protein FWC10_06865 [Lentimicrobiaceae bacterium]|nr:hypothetical protein [Lentimicrobiaceae bacterium]